MKDDAADQLDPEMLHPQRSSGRLAADRIGFRQNIVKRLAVLKALLKIRRFCLKLLIGKLQHLRS